MECLIKEILKTKKISIKEMSEDLSISYSSLRNYIKNRNEPDLKTLFDISDYLNVTVEEMYGRENPSREKELISQIKDFINQYDEIKK